VIYIVQAGDSLSAIAARLNVGLQALIDENRLAPPYDLAIGQALFVPGR
jgi:spore germination protein